MRPALKQTVIQALCAALAVLGEYEAKGTLFPLAMQQAPADAVRMLDAALACRSWPMYGPDVRQLRARYMAQIGPSGSAFPTSPDPTGNPNPNPNPNPTPTPSTPCGCHDPTGKPSGSPCGCGGGQIPLYGSNTMNNSSVNWSSSCLSYRGPDADGSGIEALNRSCKLSECQPGSTVGLQRIPFKLALAAGIEQTVTIGFTRPSRMVALTFIASPSYTVDSWTIRQWSTSNTTQAFDKFRQSTTFGATDPNTVEQPVRVFLEDGDSELSAILHGQNYLPTFVPLVNIGTNEGSISFILKNAGLVAEEIFGFVWVLFTAPKED